MSHLPVLLQLAMAERREIIALILRILARILLLQFAHGKEPGLYPGHSGSFLRYLF